MQVDGVERELSRQAQGHHHHACYPKEQNVVACFQQRSREKGLEVIVVLSVWPSKDTEREKTGGKPGIQNVFILLYFHLTRVANVQ